MQNNLYCPESFASYAKLKANAILQLIIHWAINQNAQKNNF